jgi:hypothetical protein
MIDAVAPTGLTKFLAKFYSAVDLKPCGNRRER